MLAVLLELLSRLFRARLSLSGMVCPPSHPLAPSFPPCSAKLRGSSCCEGFAARVGRTASSWTTSSTGLSLSFSLSFFPLAPLPSSPSLEPLLDLQHAHLDSACSRGCRTRPRRPRRWSRRRPRRRQGHGPQEARKGAQGLAQGDLLPQPVRRRRQAQGQVQQGGPRHGRCVPCALALARWGRERLARRPRRPHPPSPRSRR
ncbi:hypothetical protein DMC30DRAFT_402400 [Rhodotorula diobovata]|uniref:Secreted protein n=1 Tax=Rhodotorula diobovata TaxID=5288 RepID=A0A5C5FPB0_9BASI|nr:hypothetical protein DMC30DRAFT_402400 [Rhodotorula diobovata]